MDEKGVIKFKCFHQYCELDRFAELNKLIEYRNRAFLKGYIGVYSNGIGFGNISVRLDNGFLVSGSGTGMIKKSGKQHFSIVNKWEVHKNQLWCKGPVIASSESLTHAVIYDTLPIVSAILHIHSTELWKKHYHKLPFTSKNIEYGTPKMANAVIELIKRENFKTTGVFLMQGHQDGMVAFGTSLKEVLELMGRL
jgi:ribulose-5-phosphate 4-epimerase/fuculose-1-phosphate aldolase